MKVMEDLRLKNHKALSEYISDQELVDHLFRGFRKPVKDEDKSVGFDDTMSLNSDTMSYKE